MECSDRRALRWPRRGVVRSRGEGAADRAASPLPDEPIHHLTRPFVRFQHVESASGVVLVMATLVALAAANSLLAIAWQALWDTHLSIKIASFKLDCPLWCCVNDALMATLFLVIGLEIKREIVAGELRSPRKLARAGAVGGAVVPASIYMALLGGQPSSDGWAFPIATDFAFVVGALDLFGDRLPTGLEVLMQSWPSWTT